MLHPSQTCYVYERRVVGDVPFHIEFTTFVLGFGIDEAIMGFYQVLVWMPRTGSLVNNYPRHKLRSQLLHLENQNLNSNLNLNLEAPAIS